MKAGKSDLVHSNPGNSSERALKLLSYHIPEGTGKFKSWEPEGGRDIHGDGDR